MGFKDYCHWGIDLMSVGVKLWHLGLYFNLLQFILCLLESILSPYEVFFGFEAQFLFLEVISDRW